MDFIQIVSIIKILIVLLKFSSLIVLSTNITSSRYYYVKDNLVSYSLVAEESFKETYFEPINSTSLFGICTMLGRTNNEYLGELWMCFFLGILLEILFLLTPGLIEFGPYLIKCLFNLNIIGVLKSCFILTLWSYQYYLDGFLLYFLNDVRKPAICYWDSYYYIGLIVAGAIINMIIIGLFMYVFTHDDEKVKKSNEKDEESNCIVDLIGKFISVILPWSIAGIFFVEYTNQDDFRLL